MPLLEIKDILRWFCYRYWSETAVEIENFSQYFILSSGCTIKYSKQMLKFTLHWTWKCSYMFSFQKHHQGVWHFYFTKVIIIKIINWTTSFKDISAMWLHITRISSSIWCVYSALCIVRFTPHSGMYTNQIGLDKQGASRK